MCPQCIKKIFSPHIALCKCFLSNPIRTGSCHWWPCLCYLCLCTLAIPDYFFYSQTPPPVLETPQPHRDYLSSYLNQKETTIWSKHLRFLPFHCILFLCLYLGFPPVLCCRKNWPPSGLQPLCLSAPPIWEGALSVILLHASLPSLLGPFPFLRNIPRFAHLTKISLVFPFPSPVLLFLFIALIPESTISEIGKLSQHVIGCIE